MRDRRSQSSHTGSRFASQPRAAALFLCRRFPELPRRGRPRLDPLLIRSSPPPPGLCSSDSPKMQKGSQRACETARAYPRHHPGWLLGRAIGCCPSFPSSRYRTSLVYLPTGYLGSNLRNQTCSAQSLGLLTRDEIFTRYSSAL